ncbi:GntR family transcriptional regulator [Microbacterium halotolerans]|uniref:GntR family transcriptional regulator n=1 Tax=Microbacterium halotolerans TaxID=246613 RepID=UPI000E6AC687|nr:GntR family transcriptional regulator [Microbacterium halotolerans]
MGLRPLAMGEQIAHQLRVAIITGTIADGTHLTEDALATRFDVSRGPIRDALRQLQSEGLLESRRKRLYARALGIEGIEELYELREALETLAIRLAIARASSKEWDGLQVIVDQMRAAGEVGDFNAFASADMDFHTAFYDLSRNKRLREAWRPYQQTFSILFELSDTPDIPAATADHQGFLDVVRTGDADAAVKRLHLHLTLAKGHVRDVMREQEPAEG